MNHTAPPSQTEAALRAVEQLAADAERFIEAVEASAALDVDLVGGMESAISHRLAELDQLGELARGVVRKLRRDVSTFRSGDG